MSLNVRSFKAKNGLFYLVSLTGESVFGPYDTQKEANEARPNVPAAERSMQTARSMLTPQPLADHDAMEDVL